LAPQAYCLVVKDTSLLETLYGTGLPIAGQYTGSLSNGGERIMLQDAAGRIIHNLRYEDNWYRNTDGDGYSLTVKQPVPADPNALADKASWRPSLRQGGSPGTELD